MLRTSLPGETGLGPDAPSTCAGMCGDYYYFYDDDDDYYRCHRQHGLICSCLAQSMCAGPSEYDR